jgi:pimeloyl-ACP methyl ester carboxylesterase
MASTWPKRIDVEGTITSCAPVRYGTSVGKVGTQVEWFEQTGMPWISLGGACSPVVLALPGLSDGLLPLSDPAALAALASLPHEQLPFRLLAVSYRHPVDAGVTTAELADDVAAFVRDEVGGPVAVTGHSMGGMVAQWLAIRHPDLVTHLALTATLARPTGGFADVLRRWDDLVATRAWRTFHDHANEASYTGSELLRRRLLARLTPPKPQDHLAERHAALSQAALGHDTAAQVHGIRCPTLVLAGSHDPVVPVDAARKLAGAIPGARFQVAQGLRHGFPEQARDQTYRAVAGLIGLAQEVGG